MKYVVSDTAAINALDAFYGAYNWRSDYAPHERVAVINDMRAAIESFTQTLGEPAAVPLEDKTELATGDSYDDGYLNGTINGWNACREAMRAPHHPTTEKGCSHG